MASDNYPAKNNEGYINERYATYVYQHSPRRKHESKNHC